MGKSTHLNEGGGEDRAMLAPGNAVEVPLNAGFKTNLGVLAPKPIPVVPQSSDSSTKSDSNSSGDDTKK